MNDMLQAEKDDKLSDGLSRVVRVPTLLKQLEDLCRRSFDATDGVPAAACWIQLDEVEGHREQIAFSGLDKLMHAIHERVRAQLNPADLSARFGLSAIGILLDPKDGERDFRATGEALVKAVNNNLFEVGEHMIAATVSIAVRRLQEARPAELNLVRAAAAAEQLSAGGGNRCDAGDRGSTAEQQSPGSLLGQLTKALRDDSIKVVFQPLLATSGPERERVQLLPRLTAPDGSLIPAARFIPVAAKRGVLPALDHWMIARAVALLKRAVEHGDDLPQYFLNQSPALLEDSKFVDWVVEQVEPLEHDQRRLVLEFSILDLKPRIREARSVLAKLRKLGLA
ncbi:MAG: EAL domain-containing protein, partial [Wenzhouxiangellaceae bacterium]|nr:EAL domain-containing protein [Wenzhouxiangellaceae bacterium]